MPWRRAPTCAPRRGALVLYCGPMFSGKTSALLEEAAWSLRAGLRVAFLVPEVDDRHGAGAVVSHAGDALACLGVEARVAPAGPAGVVIAEGLARAADVVLVDEAQFWDPSIAGALRRLAAGGRRVAAGGLDLDWRREPFEATAALLAWADVVARLAARCSSCGAPAPYTARLAGGEERVLVGGAERYAPRCARCHGGERSGALPGESWEGSVRGGACAGGRIGDGPVGG